MTTSVDRKIDFKEKLLKKDFLKIRDIIQSICVKYIQVKDFKASISFHCENETGRQVYNSVIDFNENTSPNIDYNLFLILVVYRNKLNYDDTLSVIVSLWQNKCVTIRVDFNNIHLAETILDDVCSALQNQIFAGTIDENPAAIELSQKPINVEITTSENERDYNEKKETLKDKIEKYKFWIGIGVGLIPAIVDLILRLRGN